MATLQNTKNTRTERPMISIIIPVYNAEKYLRRCLDSLLSQTFTDFEAICINDGSPDNCPAILNDYAQQDNRIKIINQKNQGQSTARNNGLKHATGDFVCFLDSDDAYQLQTLEIAYGLVHKHNADMVCWDYELSDGIKTPDKIFNVEKIKEKTTSNPLFIGTRGKHRISLNVWTKLYKKELLDGIQFISDMAFFEDGAFVYSVLAQKPKTVIIPTSLSLYTRNANSISHKKWDVQRIKNHHAGINYVYGIYKKPKLEKELAFIKKTLVSNLLKQQLKYIRKLPAPKQPDLWLAFSTELIDLNKKGCLILSGNRWDRYLTYKKLIKNKKG